MVGGRNWRVRQREITARELDAEHHSQPGQTWRTAVVTERIASWITAAERRSESLGQLRIAVANQLLHPVTPPDDVGERLSPLTWLLHRIGDEQPLTQAGYLAPAVVREAYAEQPWEDAYAAAGPPRTESDAPRLSRLRGVLEATGVLRKRKAKLQRTSLGTKMVSDPVKHWEALVERPAADAWDLFVLQTIGLLLVDRGGPLPADEVIEQVRGIATELRWRTTGHDGVDRDPSRFDVVRAFSDTAATFELFGFLDEQGGWRDRRWRLTPAGLSTMLAILRADAVGPLSRPK